MTAISETETIQYTRELRNILPDGGEQLESKEEIYCTVQGVTPLNCACTVGRIKIKIGNIAGVGVRSTTLAYSLRAGCRLTVVCTAARGYKFGFKKRWPHRSAARWHDTGRDRHPVSKITYADESDKKKI